MRISDWSSDVCSSDLKLELAARLERHAGAVLGEGDDVVALRHGGPAEALQALQQGADAALAGVGQRPKVVQPVAELLVLGADAPGIRRLADGLQEIGRASCREGACQDV